MKKKVTITMEYIFEEEDDIKVSTFEDVRSADYDSVDRPLERMEEEGWQIISATVK